MNMITTLKSGLRAGVVALALAGTAMVAVPAQAASPSFGFQLNLGSGSSSFGPKGGIVLQFGDADYFEVCLTNNQVRQGLRNRGYSNVKIVRESNRNNKVWAIGKRYGDWYQMRVDRCTRKVDQVKEIYQKPDNSFHLTFTF